MSLRRVMVIAGEASGDTLAAECVKALREKIQGDFAPEFFGAGGPKMAEAGVGIAIDMTQHAVIGLADALKNYGKFRRIFDQLLALAADKKPDLILLVDFSGFNRRFAHAIRKIQRKQSSDWSPKIVQYVSPQVWASRPSRAEKMAADVDLLLCIFPFEKNWYAKRTPDFRVEFVGHPIFDRYKNANRETKLELGKPSIVLLPGSRQSELKRHWPVMLESAKLMAESGPMQFTLVLPNENLKSFLADSDSLPGLKIQIGDLSSALSNATLALASTGTVLIECAFFGVPTVAMYKTSWSTYQIGKRIVQVKFLSMPNILADAEIFPEFVQHQATPENISRAALALLADSARREKIKDELARIMTSLGDSGASERAAKAILKLLNSKL